LLSAQLEAIKPWLTLDFSNSDENDKGVHRKRTLSAAERAKISPFFLAPLTVFLAGIN
jgi:hypothetical protein